MAKKKKGNPHSIPKSPYEYKLQGVQYAMTVLCTVLLDKFGFDHDDMTKLWEAMYKLKEEIAEGRVSVKDIQNVLVHEYDMIVE